MNNAEKFKQIFGLYATELWSMPESDFLAWLNRDVETTQIDHNADIGKKAEGDCISRQMAIDTMADTLWHYPNECYRNLNEYEFAKALAELGLKSVPSAQPEPRWIPCSERLPKTYGAYLVQDVCGTIFVDYWRGYWLAKTTMVAWMPLPEPYRGGEE